jgi:hypothetical protein
MFTSIIPPDTVRRSSDGANVGCRSREHVLELSQGAMEVFQRPLGLAPSSKAATGAHRETFDDFAITGFAWHRI